jgi:hypothetical protein
MLARLRAIQAVHCTVPSRNVEVGHVDGFEETPRREPDFELPIALNAQTCRKLYARITSDTTLIASASVASAPIVYAIVRQGCMVFRKKDHVCYSCDDESPEAQGA